MTYQEAAARVEAAGSALVARGISPKERIGVFGANCPEWMIAMQVRREKRLVGRKREEEEREKTGADLFVDR